MICCVWLTSSQNWHCAHIYFLTDVFNSRDLVALMIWYAFIFCGRSQSCWTRCSCKPRCNPSQKFECLHHLQGVTSFTLVILLRSAFSFRPILFLYVTQCSWLEVDEVLKVPCFAGRCNSTWLQQHYTDCAAVSHPRQTTAIESLHWPDKSRGISLFRVRFHVGCCNWSPQDL